MKNARVWVVLGATEGLGPAAIKYLQATQQIVVPVGNSVIPHPDMVGNSVDFIINNSNYELFSKGQPDIQANIAKTVALLMPFLPHLKTDGAIINLPPQLCLATLADQSNGSDMLHTMDVFLSTLRQELLALDCKLHFLEPGERFV